MLSVNSERDFFDTRGILRSRAGIYFDFGLILKILVTISIYTRRKVPTNDLWIYDHVCN